MTEQVVERSSLHGEVDLVLPNDLFDVMAPDDPEEARVKFVELFAQMFPRMTSADLDVMADGLLTWRESLLADGCILHGVVALPASETGDTPVHWHIMAGVVDVPNDPDLDSAALAQRYFREQLSPDRVYTESFDTEMGWGFGLITETELTPLDEDSNPTSDPILSTPGLPSVMGVAAGLSAPPRGDKGLFVIGMCLDLEHHLEMAGIVAAIAGHSIIRLDDDETPTEGQPDGADPS